MVFGTLFRLMAVSVSRAFKFTEIKERLDFVLFDSEGTSIAFVAWLTGIKMTVIDQSYHISMR